MRATEPYRWAVFAIHPSGKAVSLSAWESRQAADTAASVAAYFASHHRRPVTFEVRPVIYPPTRGHRGWQSMRKAHT